MKITNIKAVKNMHIGVFTVLGAVFLVNLMIGIILGNLPVIVITSLIVSVLIYMVIAANLTSFVLENSGAVISIKRYYAFRDVAYEVIEFPCNKLLDFKIERAFYYSILSLRVYSATRKEICFHFIIAGLSKNKRLKLRESLSIVLENN